MWIRNQQGYFVASIHGVVYVTWVSENAKAHAAVFPRELIEWWIEIVGKITGDTVVAVERDAE
jgi:hypothetical protein